MKVEVVYALARRAGTVSLTLPAGATVREALARAGFPAGSAAGIFGTRVTLDTVLSDGDRVEIYRALAIDPKEARRRRARRKT